MYLIFVFNEEICFRPMLFHGDCVKKLAEQWGTGWSGGPGD